MNIRNHLILTHASMATSSIVTVVALHGTNWTASILAATTWAITGSVMFAWWTSKKMSRALSILENVLDDGDAGENTSTGFEEFDGAASRIGSFVQKWETVAAKNREQTRDFKAMMLMLNDRRPNGEASSKLLRNLLGGLGGRLHNHLRQIETSTYEIQQSGQLIADGADSQCHAVTKATSHVERLAETIDDLANNSTAANNSNASNLEIVTTALEVARNLNHSINRVRAESNTCEKKIQGLCDPTRQISGIVAAIGDITAKTDLLALNASIESLRAGEHGHGFTIVAEEVRKLAAQTADATREINSILEAMQVVSQESIRSIENANAEVEAAREMAKRVETTLDSVSESTKQEGMILQKVSASTNQQLQIAQDVVLIVERISQVAKSNRGAAETICWTVKSLSKSQAPVQGVIERLRNCSEQVADDQLQQSITNLESQPPVTPVSIPLLGSVTGELV